MIWVVFGSMLLAAAVLIAWPMYRRSRRLTPELAAGTLVVVALTTIVYWQIGTPFEPEAPASVDEMVASLEERLQENPDDVEGWRMLGRSYLQLEDYPRAVAAFERVVDMESAANAGSLAQLGEALLATGPEGAARAGETFESALALEPANPRALFFGGITAFQRGDRETAAERWERLLALSPPPEIEQILRPQIAEWRGLEQAAATPAERPQETDRVVAVNVSLGKGAAAAVAADATVYVIARDPARPSPPVAATRRLVSELPVQVRLSDADAMIPGRLLSAFDRLEIVARVSSSGEPTARPGDWYGDNTVSAPTADPVDIVIEQQVPRDATGGTQ